MSQRLGILVLSNEHPSDLDLVLGLCEAARERDVEVEVFLMGDGVYHLCDLKMERQTSDDGRISFCAVNAMERGLDRGEGYPWGMEESSQYELACIAERADRFIALV